MRTHFVASLLLFIFASVSGCSATQPVTVMPTTLPATERPVVKQKLATTKRINSIPLPSSRPTTRPLCIGPNRRLSSEFDTSQVPDPSKPIIHCYNAGLEWAAQSLYKECKKRFANPVLVICHGAQRDGEWICTPDVDYDGPWLVDDLAWQYYQRYQDCDIIFWICNPDGFTLNVPRVWYFRYFAWVNPDTTVPVFDPLQNKNVTHETKREFKGAGSIWELYTQNTWR